MLTPTNNYSTRRMWIVVKHNCVANSRNLTISVAVIFGLIFLMSLLMSKLLRDDSAARNMSIGFFYLFVAALATNIFGSLVFSSYSSKPKRISAMMLPARKSEKFIALNLIYVVFANLLLIASLLISDIATAGMFGLKPLSSEIAGSFFYAHEKSIPAMLTLGGIGYLLLVQAIYVLGSVLWPKLSFLKTFIAMSIVQTFLTILIPFALVGDWVYSFANFIGGLNLNEQDAIRLGWTMVCVLYAVIAGVYLLAWRRFRNLAVAKRFLS